MNEKDIRKINNFRQLGGIVTKNGRHVVDNVFYRCGALYGFNKDELEYVKSLGIETIMDFRSENEVLYQPDPKIEGANYFNISGLVDEHGKQINLSPEQMEESGELEDDLVADFLINMYKGLPLSYAYKIMFQEIMKKRVPILFHCSAGKDRTGIGAALILLALNVSEEEIVKDYMLTNEYRKPLIDALINKNKDKIKQNPKYEEVYRAFEGVLETSIRISLDSIKERFGTYENYFEQQLGLTSDDLDELRYRYTI